MIYVVYGAVGMVAVLLLLLLGAFIGWKVHVAFINHNRKVVMQELSDEDKRQFAEAQAAFSAMINYSTDTAYGLGDGTSKLSRGEG